MDAAFPPAVERLVLDLHDPRFIKEPQPGGLRADAEPLSDFLYGAVLVLRIAAIPAIASPRLVVFLPVLKTLCQNLPLRLAP